MNRFDFAKKELSKDYKFDVRFKNESFLMKCISYILFFNKAFKKSFITTIGNNIYYPSQSFIELEDTNSEIALYHELVHIDDKNNDKLFELKYLFPQILAPLTLFAGFESWFLAAMLFLIAILPWPAYWRKNLELRGYKNTLYCLYLYYKEMGIGDDDFTRKSLVANAKRMNKFFVGPDYYFMWPFSSIEKDLLKAVDDIMKGNLSDIPLHESVKRVFEERNKQNLIPKNL